METFVIISQIILGFCKLVKILRLILKTYHVTTPWSPLPFTTSANFSLCFHLKLISRSSHHYSHVIAFLIISFLISNFYFFCITLSFQNFEPKAYPKSDYGKFYTGDSYIVLNVSHKSNCKFLISITAASLRFIFARIYFPT